MSTRFFREPVALRAGVPGRRGGFWGNSPVRHVGYRLGWAVGQLLLVLASAIPRAVVYPWVVSFFLLNWRRTWSN